MKGKISPENFLKKYMAWYRGTEKENHHLLFEGVSHDCYIFCSNDHTKIARTDFRIMFLIKLIPSKVFKKNKVLMC